MAVFDIPLLLNITGSLKGFIESIGKNRQEKKENFKTAMKAVLTAVHETNLYLSGMKSKRRHDLKEESHLAALWTDAAVTLLDFDKELAVMCEVKGQNWSDPKEWSYKEINQARHALRSIEDRVRQLMEDY
jgi:hypothetical protein